MGSFISDVGIAMKKVDYEKLLTLAKLKFSNDRDNWFYEELINPKNINYADIVANGEHWTVLLFVHWNWDESRLPIGWFMNHLRELGDYEFARQGEDPEDFEMLGCNFFSRVCELTVI